MAGPSPLIGEGGTIINPEGKGLGVGIPPAFTLVCDSATVVYNQFISFEGASRKQIEEKRAPLKGTFKMYLQNCGYIRGNKSGEPQIASDVAHEYIDFLLLEVVNQQKAFAARAKRAELSERTSLGMTAEREFDPAEVFFRESFTPQTQRQHELLRKFLRSVRLVEEAH